MNTLETAIKELCEIEPFWDRCRPCISKGKCCEGAEIKPSKKEKIVISLYMLFRPLSEKRRLKENKLKSRYCIYQTPEKCLIHNVRPEVCRYTPYQCVITPGNVLKYSLVGSDEKNRCTFQAYERQLSSSEASVMRKSKFLLLDNFGRKTYYLSLNWLVQNHII